MSGSFHRFPFIFAGLICMTVCFASSVAYAQAEDSPLTLIQVNKIWDQGNHNAFTGLARFQDRFYCVFREAVAHVSQEGNIRVLSSSDGDRWESSALITLEGYDLRDPKIIVHPGGKRLMVYGGGAIREGNKPATWHQSFVSLSPDGKTWSKPEWIADVNQWLWRVTEFDGKFYGISYGVSPSSRSEKIYGTNLLVSEDGIKFETLVPDLYLISGPTEATLRFASDGTCYCLQRRDGKESNTALLGVSQPPYKEWTWKDLGVYYGGPDFIQLPDGRWIAAGRIISKDGAKTVLCELDVKEGKLQPLLTLPSGGDTSYPGLLWHQDALWVSYYSSHEGKTNIYFAKVQVNEPAK
ncbi:MAG: exo-alpha-sialidase [Candidatus Omnitrophica bacterium]|nr:exo-alpha-sialidase [Candidatus Omnitrophota bacterium]